MCRFIINSCDVIVDTTHIQELIVYEYNVLVRLNYDISPTTTTAAIAMHTHRLAQNKVAAV
jgi:hypothetical protein